MDALFAMVLWLMYIGNLGLACEILSAYPDDPQSMSLARDCGCSWAASQQGTGDVSKSKGSNG